MLIWSCALQARLESEHKANEAVLAEVQQKCKNEAEVSWLPAVHSARSKLLARSLAHSLCASCCNITNKCFYLQLYSLCNADLPTLLQAALAKQDLANQKLQAALTAVQSDKQAVVVSVRLCLVPSLLLQT